MRKTAATRLIVAAFVGMVACSQNYSDQPADVALRERGLQAIDNSGDGGGGSPRAAEIPSDPAYQTTEGEVETGNHLGP